MSGINGGKRRTSASASGSVNPSQNRPETNAATALLTPSDRAARWNFVATRCPQHWANALPSPEELLTRRKESQDLADPFDCSDLVIPSTTSKVEEALQHAISQWRDLDSRKVAAIAENHENTTKRHRLDTLRKQVGSDSGGNSDVDMSQNQDVLEIAEQTVNTDSATRQITNVHKPSNKSRLGWNEPNFVLPDNFDFKSVHGPPHILQDYSGYPRYTVVSLTGNVGEMKDYETELWNIFHAIPTEEQLLQDSDEQTGNANPLRTLQLKEEIEKGIKLYSSLDGHSLSRLRMRDMHHFPTCVSLESSRSDLKVESSNGHASQKTSSSFSQTSSFVDDIIVRVECWKRQLKRGSSADGNKLELEFYGSQTLLHVHKAIQSHTEDAFACFFQNADSEVGESEDSQESAKESRGCNSGVFFIENVFYSTGSVDYRSSIIKWLAGAQQGGSEEENNAICFPRDTYLGISRGQIQTRSMKDARLIDIPIRLGVRYFHAFNGDLQTSVFFADVRPMRKRDLKRVPLDLYPLTIDTWSFSSTFVCQGCSHCPAVVVCLDDELTDGSVTVMCTSCYHKLHYTSRGSLRYKNFRVFPIELLHHRLLSVRKEQKDALF